MLVGSTRELSSTMDGLRFKRRTFHVPNVMHTNTLNKLIIFYPEFCTFSIFVMCTQLVLIFWNKMAGRAGRYVFLLNCFESTKYTCLVCINTSVCGACSVFENDESVAG